MIEIALTHAEMWSACCVGVTRQLVSMRKGLNQHKNGITSNYQQNIEGAIAEACFAKYLGAYWSCSVNSFKAPDVGEWQVRSTAHANGRLIVRTHDGNDSRVALLITHETGATLCGWIKQSDAKQARYWRADVSSWWVPQCDLVSFDADGDPDANRSRSAASGCETISTRCAGHPLALGGAGA